MRYAHLPVFQAGYDLVVEIHQRTANFPRAHRYSIGEKLKNISFDLLDLIIMANAVKNKTEYLRPAEQVLEKLKIYIRLCFDLKIIEAGGFQFLIKKMDEISRQISGWNEWSLKNANKTDPALGASRSRGGE